MTNKEAIKVMNSTLNLMHQTNILFDDITDYKEASKVAIEAMEKGIPKKPIKVRCLNGDVEYLCPSCNIGILRMCGCQHNGCGQAIDWGEVF